MKILSAAQIREADEFTIKNEPIASIDLMERASRAFSDWYMERLSPKKPVLVFCGMGNNGGDGLAIARMLLENRYQVQVFVLKLKEKGSPDFETNLTRLQELTEVNFIAKSSEVPDLQNHIVIDAIFGSGLSKPVEGLPAQVIAAINHHNEGVVAVDIASGLFADKPSESENIVKPTYTVSFQVGKLAFLMPENGEYVGELSIVDIGLSKKFLDGVASPYALLTKAEISVLLKKRSKYAHKGDFGKALLVTGSWGKVGASVLCAKACLRTGVGLLSIHAPRCGYEILQSTVHEAMVEVDIKKKVISKIKNIDRFDTVGVGPGIGVSEETRAVVASILEKFKNPIVLDADALNILGENKKLLHSLPKRSILTPHPKEFERLAGKFSNSFERLILQNKFSKQYKCIIIVKGAHTSIATPDGEVFFNTTGNPGMATGGSGDVLTGIVTALLAQKYSPLNAAKIGVYLHGLAGDMAAAKWGEESMLPSDIIDNISDAYRSFR